MHRPTALTILGVLNIVGGLAALAMGGLLVFAGLNATERATTMVVYGAIMIAGGLLYLTAGRGLLKLEPYGRSAQMVINVIGLLGFPIGTIIYGFFLHYFSRPGVKLLFSGQSAMSVSYDERALIQRDAHGTGFLVLVSILAFFGGIAVLGFFATIALPSLMRGRVAANEQAAIGTMRAVASAEVAWQAKHQEYATPGCLVDPASCGDTASPSFLPKDPATGEPMSGYLFGFAKRAATAAPPETPLDMATATPEQVVAAAARHQAKRQADAIAARGGYALWAVPERAGQTGVRSFCLDETGVLAAYPADAEWTEPIDGDARCPAGGQPMN
jgi:hypothetical protein